MGVMGSLFPQPKITEDSDAAADGQRFRLGPIDLESGVVQLQPVSRPAQAPDDPDGMDPDDPADPSGLSGDEAAGSG